jgi:hypothetical protein
VDTFWQTTIWRQFGAAIDMLEDAVVACPNHLWQDRSRKPAYWYTVFHMRHVQHHAAQLHLLLRQEVDSAPTWVSRARE